MARTVTDAAHLLDVIVGEDPLDPGTLNTALHKPVTGYAKGLTTTGLQGIRVGVARNFWALVSK